ncbi:O-acetylhomoserine aminocarboxypropyltransferase/cysteine synthase family protein [Candidatus Halobonum tyrrellensis]|uniref:O-acetylhomoserine/O-acetylserine sulfhydrylase n=1 Tax=Candidatus Halobonum tyrrellensis G22 TaxID=1324957 RepID=V4HFV3_9EURY|nr:O-acetylhomoserine aminocarboxypropyltransferase/cysteine synthase family protein [Candidatus Halobonum tyrrellensis]ESP89585.1 O-acetylhomoserine/O-acetylserine sulfhydrylase [Candidatus Halobonum tyrrellensis G22]
MSDEDEDTRGFRTRALHAGWTGDPATGARAPPIYQTTSYAFGGADDAAALYALEREGDVYTRISNPTTRVLEERLASLEGGADAVATGSGMAAIDSITTVLARAGDNVVASTDMYGGTSAYLSHVASRRGVEARTVPTTEYDAYREAIDDDTAFVHVETLANPSLVTADFERVAEIAHEHAVPLVVDNTFGTPALCRPIEHGADIVWDSTTKWIHGAGTTVGGVVIDGGTFPWDHPEADYAELSGENAAFGVDFAERFGERAFAQVVRHRAVRALGNGQSPFDAWQTLQGLSTLPLRMDRHCENARLVAEHLRDHPEVSWVTYPGFEEHPTHDNAARYLDGFGGMVVFGLEGGFEAGKRLCEAVELTSFLANIGDARTLIIHPASTTHAQLSEEEQAAAGVTPDLLRCSVGIEDAADVIADLDRAIEEVS